MQERWVKGVMRVSGHQWLQHVSYLVIDQGLLSVIAERWHEVTSSFHLSIWEMIVTLDDLSCLLHLSIESHMLYHNIYLTRSEAVDLMVELLGSDSGEA